MATRLSCRICDPYPHPTTNLWQHEASCPTQPPSARRALRPRRLPRCLTCDVPFPCLGVLWGTHAFNNVHASR